MTGFTTKAIHTTDRDNPYGSILPPIYTTTTYAQPCDGTEGPYDYQRGGNPTRAALETTLATLEGAKHAFAYPSGMGATAAALGILKEGETLLLGMPSYGGTYRFATIELPARGVKTRFIGDFTALTDEDFADNVTMVFLESPSNPLLRVSDITAIAEIAHRNGAIVVVDNTFMTPLLQKPLDLGADISVQSATKYLGGHADLLGGVAATNDDALAERLWHLQMITGAMLSPTDSYRLLQEVKTLKLRLTQQQKNTIEVINYLEAHPAVKRVLYAGSHSEYEAQVHARQANGLGALISMELADISVQSATKYLGGHADLLGGVAATNDDALAERLWHLQMITGAMLSPTDSYRLLQEVKTLKLRLTQQQKNTIEVINYLEAHPAVKRVLYAGSHSEYEAQVHARQANGLGALISMELVDGADLPAFLEALKIFSHAVSLGGIESLVVRPALMVQAAYTQAHRDEYGVSDNLIRLAIGIEEIEDIIEDLERGLTAALAH